MNIALDIILFLIIITIIVILTWGGVTDWTFKSQSSGTGTPTPIKIVILPTPPPQTPPPQTQSPKPCPKNSYQYWDQIPHDTCYGISDGGPVCGFLTGQSAGLPTGNNHWAYKTCMKIAKKVKDEHESGMAGGLLDVKWKGSSPTPRPRHHHHHKKRYSCVQDPSILGGRCEHTRDGQYASLSDCQRNCGPAPAPGPRPPPETGCCCSSDGMVSCNESGNNSCSDDSGCHPGEYCIISGGMPGAQQGCGSVSIQPHAVQPGAHRMGFGQEYFNTPSRARISPDNFGRIKLHIPDYYY